MRHFAGLVIVSALAGFGGPALAADLPAKAPVHKAAASYNWTGFYLGVSGGGAWGTSDVSMDTNGPGWLLAPAGEPAFVAATGSPRLHGSGFIGGLQGGYNYQSGNFVVGLEADVSYSGLKISRATPVLSFPGSANFSFTESAEINWLVTVRPRVGAAFDRLFVYATGGLAVGHEKVANTMTFFSGTTQVAAGSVDKTKTGWTAGAGLEYAFADRWTAKAEFLYVDLGSVSFTTNFGPISPTITQDYKVRLTAEIVRLGLNYRF